MGHVAGHRTAPLAFSRLRSWQVSSAGHVALHTLMRPPPMEEETKDIKASQVYKIMIRFWRLVESCVLVIRHALAIDLTGGMI